MYGIILFMNMPNLQNETLSEEQFYILKKIEEEYKQGMLSLNSLSSNTVTFYGGSLIKETDAAYTHVVNISKMMVKHGYSIVSGGGPGIMKAALIGARDAGGKAIAFAIDIPGEPLALKEPDLSVVFSQFSVRKYMLRQSDAFVFCPGGLGTLDELMELLTLIKTDKYPLKPIFLLDSAFWKGYIDWLRDILLNNRKTVAADILSLFHIVDTTQEIENILFNND
jgi:uncharacterized protein (TIGR00730 family)